MADGNTHIFQKHGYMCATGECLLAESSAAGHHELLVTEWKGKLHLLVVRNLVWFEIQGVSCNPSSWPC